jgi:hydrogenase expression/formation protein HypE
VQPLEFPGGDIGTLAVNGTINDLSVAGAVPLYMTVSAIIEEGLEVAQLERIARSLAETARKAGVSVIAGDTKVVPRGQGGGLYLAATGIGAQPEGRHFGLDRIREGDKILVSGPVGDHGVAIMLAREDFDLSGSVESDCASVASLAIDIADIKGVRFMRDPTRGGLATVVHEIAAFSGHDARLSEKDIPVRDAVRSVCKMLGYDPLYLACEGRIVAVVAPEDAAQALAAWRSLSDGEEAAIIGEVTAGSGRVVLETEIGGTRVLDELEDDPLPRIC